MEDKHRRKRAVRDQVVLARAARTLVAPFNREIGSWQHRLAWLNALAGRERPEEVSSVATEARRILSAAAEQQHRFTSELERQPLPLTSERRIVDTKRAFESVFSGAERLLDRYS